MNSTPDAPDYAHHLVEAMWAGQNVERPSEKILRLVLESDDGDARSAGARVLRYWHNDLTDPIAMIAKASADSFPRTRMEAVSLFGRRKVITVEGPASTWKSLVLTLPRNRVTTSSVLISSIDERLNHLIKLDDS